MMPPPMDATAHARGRPRARWLLVIPPAALLVARGVSSLVQLAGAWDGHPDPGTFVLAALAALALVAAAALLAGHHIGWLLAMWIVGWDLAVSLVLWWIGEPQYLTMALQTLVAALITSREMRAAYARRAPA